MRLLKKINTNKGFTLIELVVVMGILSILSSISLWYFNGVNRRARELAAQNALLTIKKIVKRIMFLHHFLLNL